MSLKFFHRIRKRRIVGGVASAGTTDGARNALIESYLPLAQRLAARVPSNVERHEDLRQVAALALVRAIDRRDPQRPESLGAYVVACVEGELRRHLRDRVGTVRVPRAHRAAASAATARVPLDLDLVDVAAPDESLAEVGLDRALVARAARALGTRERHAILLHYFADRTQAEVGEELGVSQAHVSRLLAGALRKMRRHLAGKEPLSRAPHGARLGRGGDTRPSESPAV